MEQFTPYTEVMFDHYRQGSKNVNLIGGSNTDTEETEFLVFLLYRIFLTSKF